MRHRLADAAVWLACAPLGLMAGFFWTYWINVAPALRELDGGDYALVQSLLNVNVRHAVFLAGFFGAAAAPALAALLCAVARRRADAIRLGLAATLYALAVVAFTRWHILPINAATELMDPLTPPDDWASLRDAWNRANAWRAAAALAAFAIALPGPWRSSRPD